MTTNTKSKDPNSAFERFMNNEENQAFMNQAGVDYISMPDWNLTATQSGRGMSMADLDNDGDLDIVVNNLLTSSMLYENQLCSGASLSISLQDNTSLNTSAIGSYAILTTSDGAYRRDMYASSGYLSGDPSQLHFGFPEDSDLINLEIFWSDGTISTIDDLEANTHNLITRNDG